MNITIGSPIPGESQPKEPVRLIDIKEILQYDGAHFTWSGGRNCLTEQKAAYARGYDSGMKFIVDEAKKAPVIDPESLRPTAHIMRGTVADTHDDAFCSNCRSYLGVPGFDYEDYDTVLSHRYKYCPLCGARFVSADE